jgi:hypothetical protein
MLALRGACPLIHNWRRVPAAPPRNARSHGAGIRMLLFYLAFHAAQDLSAGAKGIARLELKLALGKLCTSLSTATVEK